MYNVAIGIASPAQLRLSMTVTGSFKNPNNIACPKTACWRTEHHSQPPAQPKHVVKSLYIDYPLISQRLASTLTGKSTVNNNSRCPENNIASFPHILMGHKIVYTVSRFEMVSGVGFIVKDVNYMSLP